MEYGIPQILVYVTADKVKVLGGDPLTLLITDENEKQAYITDIARSLKADVIELRNGDAMVVKFTKA